MNKLSETAIGDPAKIILVEDLKLGEVLIADSDHQEREWVFILLHDLLQKMLEVMEDLGGQEHYNVVGGLLRLGEDLLQQRSHFYGALEAISSPSSRSLSLGALLIDSVEGVHNLSLGRLPLEAAHLVLHARQPHLCVPSALRAPAFGLGFGFALIGDHARVELVCADSIHLECFLMVLLQDVGLEHLEQLSLDVGDEGHGVAGDLAGEAPGRCVGQAEASLDIGEESDGMIDFDFAENQVAQMLLSDWVLHDEDLRLFSHILHDVSVLEPDLSDELIQVVIALLGVVPAFHPASQQDYFTKGSSMELSNSLLIFWQVGCQSGHRLFTTVSVLTTSCTAPLGQPFRNLRYGLVTPEKKEPLSTRLLAFQFIYTPTSLASKISTPLTFRLHEQMQLLLLRTIVQPLVFSAFWKISASRKQPFISMLKFS